MFSHSQHVIASLLCMFIGSSSSASLPSYIRVFHQTLNKSESSEFDKYFNISQFTKPLSRPSVIDLASNHCTLINSMPPSLAFTPLQSTADEVVSSAGLSISTQTEPSNISIP